MSTDIWIENYVRFQCKQVRENCERKQRQSDRESCQLISDLLRDLIIVHRYAELATKHRWSDWPTWTAENDQLTRERDEAREAARYLTVFLSDELPLSKIEARWPWLKESP